MKEQTDRQKDEARGQDSRGLKETARKRKNKERDRKREGQTTRGTERDKER